MRAARVRALAKINLDLRVLGRRPDGYHELRTIFQTISLADRIDIAFFPGRGHEIELDDPLAIPDNLVVRAARGVTEAAGTRGTVRIRLEKRIPMGAGLGGGSSDAAAVLLALPVLAGRRIPMPRLFDLAQQLGSDVPFFLLGGTAVGIGRGTELFPLPDGPAQSGVIVAPDVAVSTAEAYARLSTRLTTPSPENKMIDFQLHAWDCGGEVSALANDFEPVVFEQHTQLALLKKRLQQAGAAPAMMTGSGSAIFGLFPSRERASRAVQLLDDERTFHFRVVSRARYRSMWWRALQGHIDRRTWPPQSRYTR
jgi:4-diphosphocytidyl-2-C-methyl-D-erythritol kinase